MFAAVFHYNTRDWSNIPFSLDSRPVRKWCILENCILSRDEDPVLAKNPGSGVLFLKQREIL